MEHQDLDDAGSTAGGHAPRGSASSSVLERAKSNAKRVSKSSHTSRPPSSSHSHHKTAVDHGEGESDREDRQGTAPLSSPCRPSSRMKDHSTSDRQMPLSPPVEVSDDSDEDTMTRISNAISKASSKSGAVSRVSRVSVSPSRKHHDGAPPKKNSVKKMSPKLRVYTTFAFFEIIILALGLWVSSVLESMTYKVELSSLAATLNLSNQFLFTKPARLALGFKSMSQEQLFILSIVIRQMLQISSRGCKQKSRTDKLSSLLFLMRI